MALAAAVHLAATPLEDKWKVIRSTTACYHLRVLIQQSLLRASQLMSRISRFTADTKYPVTQTLFELFHGSSTGSNKSASKGPRKTYKEGFAPDLRNDIVSDSLCGKAYLILYKSWPLTDFLPDDTIKYLAPTLEKHKGCTIIDIHPGASVWSSKLHDFLQPKRHLLMEPEERYFASFIKPLLDKPGSTYRHTTLIGAHPREYWPNYAKVLSDAELAPCTPLLAGDPALRELNPNVLVIGNLGRQYKVAARARSVNFGALILQQFLHAALTNQLFHRSGLVRMMLWVPEAEKYTLFPTSEVYRRSLNVRLGIGSSLTEVVGSVDLYDTADIFYARRRRRPPELEAILAQRAQRRMDDLGVQVPPGRALLYDRPKPGDSKLLSPFETAISTWQELEAEIATTKARLAEVRQLDRGDRRKGNPTQKQQREEGMLRGMKYPQCEASGQTFIGSGNNVAWIAIWADLGMRVLNLEVALRQLEEKGEDPATYERVRDRILKLDRDLDTIATSESLKMAEFAQRVVEQQQACLMEPPITALDARAYEPLKATPRDFWPNSEMMLLDMVPKPCDLEVEGLASKREMSKLCETFCRSLLESTTRTLPEALDRLAPNAARDVIPMVDIAKDPRKGGRLNPHRIRVRMVSDELIEGLLKAWVEWPFKPSLTDLVLASESSEGVSEEAKEAEVEE
ncbi:hypothetical protein LTR01_006968 [Friedmanniomyces endolithicus]|nr:hypothetical protein LTR01_006968 [Friedmanniomyces endolithicus]